MGTGIKPSKFEKFLDKNHWKVSRTRNQEVSARFANKIEVNGEIKFKTGALLFAQHRNDLAQNAVSRGRKQFNNLNETTYRSDKFKTHIRNCDVIIKKV